MKSSKFFQIQDVYNASRRQVISHDIADRIREDFENGIATQLSMKVSEFHSEVILDQ